MNIKQRIQAQVERFGLDKGDDKSTVIERAGVIFVTSDLAEPCELRNPKQVAEDLEALPDSAVIGPDEAPEGELSVWDILENG